ncbi:MAG: class I SAM-dependent methyltransferase, partial [Gammaproteobacteria bacterium]|nr:class I SAM-dependent methyltransferase [Gammaproteobacteria bacterium]
MMTLRLLALADAIWLRARAWRHGEQRASTDGAGVQAHEAVPLRKVGDVCWPEFDTLAHSFWRAQEVTLFRRHASLVREPVLDLGCGDGVFARLADWPAHATGLDFDEASLRARAQVCPGAQNVRADAGRMPLLDGAFATCVSNSVFEHLPDLDACLRETQRVLQPAGRLVFTMTLGTFSSQLRSLTGTTDARGWLERFGHRQEPDEADLLRRVAAVGFTVEQTVSYQPLSFTARYRRLVSPVFQFHERRQTAAWRTRQCDRLAGKVGTSLVSTPAGSGACVFVV